MSAQAAMVQDAEDRAIAQILDHTEENRLPASLAVQRTLCAWGFGNPPPEQL